MKILHIINSPFVLPYFFGDQYKFLKSKSNNIEIYVACAGDDMLYNLEKSMHFKAIPISITRNLNFINDLKVLFQLIKAIKYYKIDIVVSHTPKAGFIGMLSAFLCNIDRRIYFRHGFLYQTAQGFSKKILIFIEKLAGHLANKVVCVSHSVLNESITRNLSKANNTMIINRGSCNGIDVFNKYNPDKINQNSVELLRTKLNIKNNDFVVGYVGRIVRDKGIEELIEAWNLFKINKENVKLLIIGPLETRNTISKNSFNFIQNDISIIHIDFTNNTELYYSLMNIFILPSKREGLPTVVLEASSMKLPVITTRVTGCIDSIIDNYTGSFVDLSSKSISDMINYYYNNPQLANQIGNNGRKFTIENFDQNIIWNSLFTTLYK